MPTRFTRADYDLLPEGFPAQLIAGRLVREPAPTYEHQRLVAALFRLLAPLVEPGLLLTAPVDVAVDELNVFQPDLVVLDSAPLPEARAVGVPRLAIEVVSPGTRGRDRRIKAPRLLAAGVLEVWLVDPRRRVVERHDGLEVVVAGGETPLASRAVEGFAVRPESLFRSAP